jgi:hypothetical protein
VADPNTLANSFRNNERSEPGEGAKSFPAYRQAGLPTIFQKDLK